MYTYSNTILNQLLQFIPKSKFQAFVGQHQGDRYVKSLTTWNQLVILLYAQATGKSSLREIEIGLKTHPGTWYHTGIGSVARSTLSDANNRRPYEIFRKLFAEILTQCKEVTPKSRGFSFKNPLYALDSTTIILCLSLFDWALYSKQKGALKLHTLLDLRSSIPEIMDATHGKVDDRVAGRQMNLSGLPKGSIIVMDRAYMDYAWWRRMSEQGLFFVTRQSPIQVITDLGQHTAPNMSKGILKDRRVRLGTYPKAKLHPKPLRQIIYYDQEKQETYTYLTNNWKLAASTIADIYKHRWQIELFFKWIKQHLKIRSFLGTSQNAVLTQIWVAIIYYLLLAYIKFQTKFTRSLLELTRMILETLLIRRPLIDLLSLNTKTIARLQIRDGPQLGLF